MKRHFETNNNKVIVQIKTPGKGRGRGRTSCSHPESLFHVEATNHYTGIPRYSRVFFRGPEIRGKPQKKWKKHILA